MNRKHGTVCPIELGLAGRLKTLSDTKHAIDDNGIDTLFLLQLSRN